MTTYVTSCYPPPQFLRQDFIEGVDGAFSDVLRAGAEGVGLFFSRFVKQSVREI